MENKNNYNYLEKYTEKVNINEYNIDNLEIKDKTDLICIEKNCKIYLNEKYIYSTVCSPEHIKELAVGHLFSEKVISINTLPINFNNLSITIKEEYSDIFVYITISSNTNDNTYNNNKHTADNTKLKISTIKKILNYMGNVKGVWEHTGGTHWACISDLDGNIIINIEDIGRHNAIDKVIGYCILNNIVLTNKILISSGRTPLNSVLKCANCNIPILISKSPTTNKGINIAKENNILLIGFARKNKITVYNNSENIII